jgi:hypothetical protein
VVKIELQITQTRHRKSLDHDTGLIFYAFAVELSLLLLVIKFLMPETKGRTIEEIERSWLVEG